jgi:hypothetical protein
MSYINDLEDDHEQEFQMINNQRHEAQAAYVAAKAKHSASHIAEHIDTIHGAKNAMRAEQEVSTLDDADEVADVE